VLDTLVNAGLATREKDGIVKVDDLTAERVALAQLYGMSDTLTGTDRLATSVRTLAPFRHQVPAVWSALQGDAPFPACH